MLQCGQIVEAALPDPEPEFDPATWTPDKPWPKGYYKPMPIFAQLDRGGDTPGSDVGIRRFLWSLFALPLQILGLAALGAARAQHGMLHRLDMAVTPWPLFLLFALVLPVLIFMGVVPPPGTPPRRSLAYGLLASLLLLVVITLPAFLRPALQLVFAWVKAAAT